MCLYVLSSGNLYFQLFVGRLVSYLRYLCLFAYSGIKHILCCVFLFCFSSSCCQFLWIVHFLLPLRAASFSRLSILYFPFGIL